MATKKKSAPVTPLRAPRPVELSDIDKAKLEVYVGYAEFARSQVIQFVGSLAKKYDLAKDDSVMPDGTIVRAGVAE